MSQKNRLKQETKLGGTADNLAGTWINEGHVCTQVEDQETGRDGTLRTAGGWLRDVIWQQKVSTWINRTLHSDEDDCVDKAGVVKISPGTLTTLNR